MTLYGHLGGGEPGGPYFDDLVLGQVFDWAPSMTLTPGVAAVHQQIVGEHIHADAEPLVHVGQFRLCVKDALRGLREAKQRRHQTERNRHHHKKFRERESVVVTAQQTRRDAYHPREGHGAVPVLSVLRVTTRTISCGPVSPGTAPAPARPPDSDMSPTPRR